jgi:hypothetical protein
MKKVISFLSFITFVGFLSSGLQQAGASPFVAYASAFLILMGVVLANKHFAISNIAGVYKNGIDTEIWLPDLMPTLFKSNEFLLESTDHSSYVNNLTVHIPQEAVALDWDKNPAVGGAPDNTNVRVDTVLDYNIDVWASKPMLVTDAEMKQLSYDKRVAVLQQIMKKGKETIADNVLYAWRATGTGGNILRTTGIKNNDVAEGVEVTSLVVPGATGFRKYSGLYDLRQASLKLDKMRVPNDGNRVAIYSANQYQQLMDDCVATKYRDGLQSGKAMKTGQVNEILGFRIYMRAETLSYTNAGTPVAKVPGAAAAATDNDAILCFHPDFVARAIGDNKIFYNADMAVNLGDVMRVLIRMGASKCYTNETGVVAIVQDAAA